MISINKVEEDKAQPISTVIANKPAAGATQACWPYRNPVIATLQMSF
jgi:hypothetical protein